MFIVYIVWLQYWRYLPLFSRVLVSSSNKTPFTALPFLRNLQISLTSHDFVTWKPFQPGVTTLQLTGPSHKLEL
jgi:hypothetical protein